jgi:flagellar biosynthetic protein FliR
MVLATLRTGAFVAGGGLIPKSIPRVLRGTPALAFALVIARPVQGNPDMSTLVVAAFTNTVVGYVLGWLLGLAVHPFQVAGTMLDTSAGLTVGALFDKEMGNTPGPISRIMTTAAMTLVIVLGGLGLAAKVLAASVDAVALDGTLHALPGMGPIATRAATGVIRSGVQLALPITAVLFIAELAFGLLSRTAPQMNSFLVGLPLKLLSIFFLLGGLVVVFPGVADRALADGVNNIRNALGLFGG